MPDIELFGGNLDLYACTTIYCNFMFLQCQFKFTISILRFTIFFWFTITTLKIHVFSALYVIQICGPTSLVLEILSIS